MSDRFINFINGDIRRATLWHCLLIAVVGLAAYSSTFGAPFNFDDVRHIVGSPGMEAGSMVGRPLSLSGTRAVGVISFALNYRLHGLNVVGYHVVNIAIHLANALLVYALVGMTGSGLARDSRLTTHPSPFTLHLSRSIALFAALIFVAHPVQTQAVSYIIQRFASLATFFCLAALVLYIRSRLEPRRVAAVACYLLGLLAAVLAMKTKEIAFTLPVVIALYELLFFRGGFARRIAGLVPYLSTMLIIPLHFVTLGRGVPAGQVLDQARQATAVQTVLPRADYLFTQFRVIVTYLRLLIFPVNQNLDYDYPVYQSFFAPPVFLSFLLLLALFAIAVFLLFHNSRLIAFGILWFFITLSVESSVIPIVDVIFEHRVYLPSIGAILAFVSAVAMFAERRRLAVPMFAAMTVVVVIFACAAFRRNLVWGDDVRLWDDATTKSPNLSRPWNNLGYAWLKRNEPGRAVPPLVRSIELNPAFTDAYLNIELALSQIGTFGGKMANTAGMVDARGNVDVRRLRRWGSSSNNNLGLAYEWMGRGREAAASYEKALRFDPEMSEASENLARIRGRGTR